MKEWFKSLFPWRWTIVLLFIVSMSWLIAVGFEIPEPREYFIGEQWIWHMGNVVLWLFVDYGFGLSREGNFFKIK